MTAPFSDYSNFTILMRRHSHISILFALLTFAGIFSFSDTGSQTSDTTKTINFPLPYEDLSLYDFASVRTETNKTEVPPVDITKRNFRPAKEFFTNAESHFADSIKSVWIKFQIANNQSFDTSIALRFPGVSKAVLYKAEGDRLIQIGKTGFFIAVLKRNVSYEDARIDIVLKAHSVTNYFIQVINLDLSWKWALSKMPVLENIPYAEMKAFKFEKKVNRPIFMSLRFFTGVFFMFFVFGFIKYLVFGKDKSYLYFALIGLTSVLLSIAATEHPPLELPSFENLRGVELVRFMSELTILTQGLFILEVSQLKIKYPRITRWIRGIIFARLLFNIPDLIIWIISHAHPPFVTVIRTFNSYLYFLFMLSWVLYLATIRKGFYRFIFLGALTILIAFTLEEFFNVGIKGSSIVTIALVIDLCFYLTGLAYRDKQVEKDKIIFQEQLIKQLEANKNLQEKFTGELEQQVKEKTTELIEQRQALEIEKEAKLLADFNRKFSESELKALRAQMNPHFVFNILNTIESYALDNNKEAASVMIQKFSRLTRLVLENSMNPLVPFENDLKSLQLYIELEQMRYADKFTVVYNIQEQITEGDYVIPPMIIQPFVENAIIHGLRNKADGDGILNLSASLRNEYIIVQVEDNGIGRIKAAALKVNNPIQKKSLGLKVTQDRIAMFNNLNKDKKANVEIEDLHVGTRVVILLPAQHYN
jgi:sensor histidine kinase YesM